MEEKALIELALIDTIWKRLRRGESRNLQPIKRIVTEPAGHMSVDVVVWFDDGRVLDFHMPGWRLQPAIDLERRRQQVARKSERRREQADRERERRREQAPRERERRREQRASQLQLWPERKPPRTVKLRTRFAVLERDGWTCRYCGRGRAQGAVLHVDHVVPLALGGSNEDSNLVTACDLCNLGKSARPLRRDPPPREVAEIG